MRRGFTHLALAVAASAAAATGGSASAQDDQPTGNSQRGQQIYTTYGCYQCHGRVAQGASTGPRLAPDPMPFAAFLQYIRKPAGEMPPYTVKIVPDQDAADIYVYLRTLPQPPALETIPLLK